MNIIDISQEIFSSNIFPGDPIPRTEPVLRIERGADCNLTEIKLGSHTATHIDAPSHFISGAKTIDEIDLSKCVGMCKVIELEGEVGPKQIKDALKDGTKRLLIKGDIILNIEAAMMMTRKGLELIGVEGFTVGTEESIKEIHIELLSKEVVILEGLVLSHVIPGRYMIAAQPLKLGGLDGSPCRPVLFL